jgi:hypothetical protein
MKNDYVDSEIHVKVKRDLSHLRTDVRPPLYIEEGLINNTEIVDISLREKLNRSTFLKSNTRFPNLIQSINNMVQNQLQNNQLSFSG